MDANSSQVGSTQAFGFRFHGNFNISNDMWEAQNLLLDDTPQIHSHNLHHVHILMLLLIYLALFLIYLLKIHLEGVNRCSANLMLNDAELKT